MKSTRKNNELNCKLPIYEEFFRIKYSPEHWQMLKFKGEFFIKLYANLQEIPEEGIKVSEVIDFKHKLWSARMILGVGCELIVKSAFLKNGFIINKLISRKNLPKGISKNGLYKFEEFKKIKKGAFPHMKTETISNFILINNLSLLIKERIEDNSFFGFQISRLWRNTYAHGSNYPYDIFGNENELVFSALNNLYKLVFNEECNLLKDKKLIL